MVEQTISKRAWTPGEPEPRSTGSCGTGATWPVWSPIESFELEQEGPDGGESLGAIRVFRTGRATSREEIVELEPDRRFSYALLSGLPLRGYRADVDLEPRDGGTAIHWHSTLPRQAARHRRDATAASSGAFIQRASTGSRALRRRHVGSRSTPTLRVASWAWPRSDRRRRRTRTR